MRALTVRQPWAWAIIHGGKDVENRSRNIAGSYCGPVAIHVGRQFADMPGGMPREIARAVGEWSRANPGVPSRDLPDDPRNSRPIWFGHLGAFIGVVDLIGVHDEWDCMSGPTESMCSPWAMTACGGPHDGDCPASVHPMRHLVLANPRPLPEPIPARGKLGLWTPDPDAVEQLQAVTR